MEFAVVLAGIGAMFLGGGDFLSRRAAMDGFAMASARWSFAMGGVISLPLLVVISSNWDSSDALRGLAGGLFSGVALILLFHGFTVASPAIVAPSAAVVSATEPVLFDVVQGAAFTALVALGLVIGVVGLALTTWTGEVGANAGTGIFYGLAGGVSFGAALIMMGQTSESSGVWPTITQRAAGTFVISLILLATQRPTYTAGDDRRRWAAIGGLVASIGVVAVNLAAQRGPLGPVAVAGSMFPAMTVLLVTTVDKQPLRWWQAVGVVVSLVAVALITLG